MKLKSHSVDNIQAQKFQVKNKQGIAIAINTASIDKDSLRREFSEEDGENLVQMSASCLRRLNRERDLDIKNRMIHAYKGLFRIGINLDSR